MSDPWFKFFVADWRSDPKLRMCSLAARGLWMEMICIMHEAENRGYLAINGVALNAKHIAMQAGIMLDEAEILIEELEIAGVFSRKDGTIFSRKMVKEQEVSIRNSQNGKAGGNPALKNPDNRGDKAGVKATRARAPYSRRQISELDSEKEKKESLAISDSGKSLDVVRPALEKYQATAKQVGWPAVSKLTKTREVALRGRVGDAGGIDGWNAAIDRAAKSPHLTGVNDRGWRANFDFFLQQKSFLKLIEGAYDDRKPTAATSHFMV